MKQYFVDAFTDKVFAGNPAAICVIDQWLPEELMMNITRENNLSETAFIVKEQGQYRLRWFTPGGEIDLCGHATLASAFVVLNYYEPGLDEVVFHTVSGPLRVTKRQDLYEMSFPAYDLTEVAVTDAMERALGVRPLEAYMGRDLLCVLKDEEQVRSAAPDQEQVKKLDGLLVHITAPGREWDCVSRSFGPKLNIAEDPVCGSGHCHIVPYWQRILQKQDIVACQASARGGTLYCTARDGRMILAGKAVLFSVAELQIGI